MNRWQQSPNLFQQQQQSRTRIPSPTSFGCDLRLAVRRSQQREETSTSTVRVCMFTILVEDTSSYAHRFYCIQFYRDIILSFTTEVYYVQILCIHASCRGSEYSYPYNTLPSSPPRRVDRHFHRFIISLPLATWP